MDEQDTYGRGNQMTREEMVVFALKCGFNDKQFDSMFYKSGPYDISFPTTALESFYRAAFAAGQAEMRERAAVIARHYGPVSQDIRALSIKGENK